MTSKQDLKNRVRQAIDDKADEIVRVSKTILDNPETGFREVKTAKLVADLFGQWGIQHRKGLALTGIKGVVEGGASGPTVAVLGRARLTDSFGASPRRLGYGGGPCLRSPRPDRNADGRGLRADVFASHGTAGRSGGALRRACGGVHRD